MTYDQMLIAKTAVDLAIRECLLRKQDVTYAVVFDYAHQYSKRICTVEHIQAAMAIMNFELMNNLITELNGEAKLARIKALRDKTALPLLRCKQALEQHNWDIVAAKAYLHSQSKPNHLLINERSL